MSLFTWEIKQYRNYTNRILLTISYTRKYRPRVSDHYPRNFVQCSSPMICTENHSWIVWLCTVHGKPGEYGLSRPHQASHSTRWEPQYRNDPLGLFSFIFYSADSMIKGLQYCCEIPIAQVDSEPSHTFTLCTLITAFKVDFFKARLLLIGTPVIRPIKFIIRPKWSIPWGHGFYCAVLMATHLLLCHLWGLHSKLQASPNWKNSLPSYLSHFPLKTGYSLLLRCCYFAFCIDFIL